MDSTQTGLISRLFDKLGITAPVAILMKKKLQEIWRNGQHWDEELPKDLQLIEAWTPNSASLNEYKFIDITICQPLSQ